MTIRKLALVMLATTLLAPAAFAEESGFQKSMLADIDQVSEKLVGLAKAIPESKYDWRPMEGVNSVAEAIQHVAGANLFFSSLFGVERPDGIGADVSGIKTQAGLVDLIEKSVANAKMAVTKWPEADLDSKMVKLGPNEMPARQVLFVMTGHMHEHTGQLIAYARSNDVVPPWSQ